MLFLLWFGCKKPFLSNLSIIKLKKLFTETYDFRLHHIEILEKFGFKEQKRIKTSFLQKIPLINRIFKYFLILKPRAWEKIN